jgi:RNA polymerase sigma factor (sigma-70 family)
MLTSASLQYLVGQMRRTAGLRPLDTASDTELLEYFHRHGDPEVFALIVRRYGAGVLASCRKVLVLEADVEDAFQATFLVLLQSGRTIRRGQALGGWLSGVAHRVALKALASTARRQRAEQQKPPPTNEGPDLSWREACAILHEELDRLPDQFRLPLLLCYLEGKSRDEAAQQLGCTIDTLRGRLERGREHLRVRLTRRGVTLSIGLFAAVATSVTAGGPPQILIEATLLAAASGRTSGTVATLVHEATTTMIFGKIKLVVIALLAVGLLSAGLGWQILGSPSSPPAKPPADKGKPGVSDPKPGNLPQDKDNKTVQWSGRVLDPEGKPVAGARLFGPRFKKNPPTSLEDLEAVQVGTSGTDGRFRVTLQKSANKFLPGYLLAHAEGFGIDWIDLVPKEPDSDEKIFKLVKDQPITGRVLDTEGKPRVGVNVFIQAIEVPENDKLDDYLADWKKSWGAAPRRLKKGMYIPSEAIHGLTTTDTNGHFKVTGAGSERIVRLTIQGKGVAKTTFHVLTRAGLDSRPYQEAALAQDRGMGRIKAPILSGPQATFVVEVGKVIEGVVKDLATSKPLAGVRVGAVFGWSDEIHAVTDMKGKYRLEGLPQDKNFRVKALPPTGSSYLPRSASAEAPAGSAPVYFDLELARGVVVSGRVLDRQTGNGVRAWIHLAPLTENKYFGKPGFDGYRTDRMMENTDQEGRFRVVTIPGKSLLMVQVPYFEKVDGEKLCPYQTARPDPDYKDLFNYQKNYDTWSFTSAGGRSEFLGSENVVKVVDLKEDGGEVKIDLPVERGQTAPVLVQDPDGKPLSGVLASGLMAQMPTTPRLNATDRVMTVYGLDPARPRRVVFFHREKKLGGTVLVRGDEKEQVAIKLAPIGSVSGRFLEGEGEPLVGAEITVNCPYWTAFEMYRYLESTAPSVRTDKEGRFTIPGVVPGMKFYLNIRKDKTYYSVEPKIGLREVEPAQTLDLGDRRLKPQS